MALLKLGEEVMRVQKIEMHQHKQLFNTCRLCSLHACVWIESLGEAAFIHFKCFHVRRTNVISADIKAHLISKFKL